MNVVGRVGRAADALVRWRLGLIEYHRVDAEAAADERSAAEFWAASRVADPAPITAAPVPPGWVRSARALDLRGASAGPGDHPGAHALRARAYLQRADDAPFVLLLHGYAAAVPTYEEHHARLLLRRGLHAARLDLPYHLGRRPPRSGAGAGFFSSDPYRTAAMLRQATEDAAAVIAWARAEFGRPVGVLGFSLGGLVACLLAATVPLDAVVAVTPPCDLADVVLRRTPTRIRRSLDLRAAAAARLESALAPVTPHLLTPVTQGTCITLVAADNDGIVGAAAVRTLALAWGAELLAYPHGHATVMTARGITRRLHDRLLAGLISSR